MNRTGTTRPATPPTPRTHSASPAAGVLATTAPPAEVCERRVSEAQRVFRKTLANWASDMLLLRHRHLAAPTWQPRAAPTLGVTGGANPGDATGGFSQAA